MPREKRMRLETRRKPAATRPLHLNLGIRPMRPRGDTEYLLGSPATAERLHRALADSASGRTHESTLEELYGRYGLECATETNPSVAPDFVEFFSARQHYSDHA